MSRVPVITSPCPYRWSSAPKPGQDFCGQCARRVHNLDYMSTSERETFFAGCSGEVCVSYSVRRPMRAIALGAGLVAAAALAGSASADSPADNADEEEIFEIVITGGTVSGEKVQWVDDAQAALPDKPDLPEIATVDWLPTPKG